MKRLLIAIMLAILPAVAFSQTTTYVRIGGEWGTFTLTEAKRVRYGTDIPATCTDNASGMPAGCWIENLLQAGTHPCGPASFGNRDPARGVIKQCERIDTTAAVEPPVTQPPLPTAIPVPACHVGEQEAREMKFTKEPAGDLAFMLAPMDTANFILTWACEYSGMLYPHGLAGFKSDMKHFVGLTSWITATREEKNAIWQRAVKCNTLMTTAECEPYRVLDAKLKAQMGVVRAVTVPTPAPAWKVAPNGTSPSRPVYPFVQTATGGVGIGPVAPNTMRVAVGQPCNCVANMVKAGTTTYCSVAGLDNHASTLVPKAKLSNVGAICKLP